MKSQNKLLMPQVSFFVSILAFVVAVGTPVYNTYERQQAAKAARALEEVPNPYAEARFDFTPSAASSGYVVWRNSGDSLDYSSAPGMGVVCWAADSGSEGVALLWYGNPKNGKTVMKPLILGFGGNVACGGSPVVFKYNNRTLTAKEVSQYAAESFAALLPSSEPRVIIPASSAAQDEKP